MKKLRLLILFCVAVAPAASLTAAEAIYPLVTYKCNPEADILTLTNSLLRNDEGASYQYSDEDGTFSPWNLVEIDRSIGTYPDCAHKKNNQELPAEFWRLHFDHRATGIQSRPERYLWRNDLISIHHQF